MGFATPSGMRAAIAFALILATGACQTPAAATPQVHPSAKRFLVDSYGEQCYDSVLRPQVGAPSRSIARRKNRRGTSSRWDGLAGLRRQEFGRHLSPGLGRRRLRLASRKE